MSKIVPFLWFAGEAEEAVRFYVSIFKNSRIDRIRRYGEAGPGPSGSPMVIEFQLDGRELKAINGSEPEAPSLKIALFVTCETQAEVDRLWERLSEGGETLQCGWLRDKYGFSWNIVPAGLEDLVAAEDPERSQRAMRAMLQMEKLDIDAVRRAYDGE